ncbi:MAG: glycosyltransferase, partial [Casimicrobiaceae bacterium]
KGLFAWIGYPTRELAFDREARHAGRSNWNWWRLWNFALEGITSFSAVPLKLASYIGLLTALIAFAYGVYVVIKTLVIGDPVRGYPTLVTLILFLGGLQLMALGIIGEYLARMFVEVKQRPLYLVQRHLAPQRTLGARAGAVGEEMRSDVESSAPRSPTR